MENQVQKRILFAWDGSHEMIRDAMNQARPALENHAGLFAIHAMPHELIYTYGATSNQGRRPPAEIQNLSEDFGITTKNFACFESVNLVIAFGDRIHEICFYANRVKADLIVAAYFRQSGFSKWIHGDLNQRLVAKAPCEVLFVGEAEPKSSGGGVAACGQQPDPTAFVIMTDKAFQPREIQAD